MTRGGLLALLLAAGLLAAAPPALAQSWTADVYAGGTQQMALAGRIADTNLIGNVRYAGRGSGFLYLSGAAPLNSDAVPWAAAGLGRRFEQGGAARAGLDIASHGYLYGGGQTEPGGSGGTLHVLPYVAWQDVSRSIELRAGRHEHRLQYDGEVYGSGLYEVGVRAGAVHGAFAAQLSGRWLADDTTSFPFAGLQLGADLSPARLWVSAGRWLTADGGSTDWSVGTAFDVGQRGQVWAGFRSDSSDPLYENVERTTWNIGYSHSFGRWPGTTTVPAPRVREGGVVFRLPRTALVGDPADGAPAVAGEFSGWKPLTMRLTTDDEWTLELAIPSGVHRFSFLTGSGQWFVPEGYPGRIDDGMGGWVAILVVP